MRRVELNPQKAARVLVVEDEALVAEDLSRLVTALGYAVVAVTGSGEEAVELASALRPDLVLMDWNLQGSINGFEAGNSIQRLIAATVIYVSANPSIRLHPYFVQKPFCRAAISQVLTSALAAKQDSSSLPQFSSEIR
jgi:CheY-like chemotaxis protein